MGIQSRIVVAAHDSAAELAEADEPSDQWECVTINGLHNIHLATLFAVLSSGEINDSVVEGIVNRIENKCQASTSLDPDVFLVPADFRDKYSEISSMDDEEVAAIAENWARTDELEGWEIDDVRAIIRTVGDLADSAKWSDKCLWLWMGP